MKNRVIGVSAAVFVAASVFLRVASADGDIVALKRVIGINAAGDFTDLIPPVELGRFAEGSPIPVTVGPLDPGNYNVLQIFDSNTTVLDPETGLYGVATLSAGPITATVDFGGDYSQKFTITLPRGHRPLTRSRARSLKRGWLTFRHFRL